MTTARDLRSWLMTQPRPTLVRLQAADGTFAELACAGQPWARLGESCAAMDPVTIYAIDANGKLIRVAKVADIAEGLDDDETCSSSSSSSSSSTDIAPAQIQRDDPRAMLAVLDKFGTLLANAHEFSTKTAFAEMVRVVDLFAQATVQIQKEAIQYRTEVRRLERDMIDEAMEKAEASGDGDMMKQFIGAYFGGQAERFAQQATNAVVGNPPNGTGPKPGVKQAAAPTPPNGKGVA